MLNYVVLPKAVVICSMKELNLPNAPEEKGIMVLNDSYEIGQAFFPIIKEGGENMSWFDKLFGEDDSNDDLIHRKKEQSRITKYR